MRWSRTASAVGVTPSAGAWRSIAALSASRADSRYQRPRASAAAPASGARSSSAPALQPALTRAAVTIRSGSSSPPCHATPGRSSASAAGCCLASARSSQGVSVFSAPSIAPARAPAGTTSSGPTPGTSTSRRRRARVERRRRTFTVPLRSSKVRSPSTAGTLRVVQAEQITEALAVHGEGPCWLARSGELAWVDMLAGRVLATSLATATTQVVDIPGPVAAIVRPRAVGGVVVATETGVVLLDEHDSPSPLCEILREPGIRMNDGACDPQGRFWCGSMAYAVREGAGSLYRVEADGSFATALTGVTISNGLDWSDDGATVFYVDTPTGRIDTFAFDPATGDLSERRPFVEIDPGSGHPDGLTIDAEGGVWVALWEGGAVRRYAPGRHARRRRLAALRSGHGLHVRRRGARRALHHDVARGTPARGGSRRRRAVPLPAGGTRAGRARIRGVARRPRRR